MHCGVAASAVPLVASAVHSSASRRAACSGGVTGRELCSSSRRRVAAAYASDDVSEQPLRQQQQDATAAGSLPPPPPPPPPEARGQLRRTRFSDIEFENPRFAPRNPGPDSRRDRGESDFDQPRSSGAARGRGGSGRIDGQSAPRPEREQGPRQGLQAASQEPQRQPPDLQSQNPASQPAGQQLRRTRFSGGEPRRAPSRDGFVVMPHIDAIKRAETLDQLFEAVKGADLSAVEVSIALHMVVLNARRAYRKDEKARAAVCARPEVTQLLEQALETHQDWDVQASYNGLGSLAEIDTWAPSDASSRALGAVAVRVRTLLMEGRRFNDRQLAWVLWSFGVNRTLQQRATPLLDSVVAAIGDAAVANSVAPDAVTMMLRDAATLELHKSHPGVVEQLQRCVALNTQQLNADRLAGALQCLGAQGCSDATVLQPVADALVERLGAEAIKERYIQGAVLGLHKASEACAALDAQPLLGGLLEAAAKRAAKQTPRQLGDLVWSFAQFSMLPDTPARQKLVELACKCISSKKTEPAVAARILWALPRLGQPVSPEVLSDAADRIITGRSARLEHCSGWLCTACKVSKRHPRVPKVANTAERLLRGWASRTSGREAASAAAAPSHGSITIDNAVAPAAALSPLETLRTAPEASPLPRADLAESGAGEGFPATAANSLAWPKGFTQQSLRELAQAAAELEVPVSLVRAMAEFAHPRLEAMDVQTQQALLATLAKRGVKDQPLAGALADRMEAAVPVLNFDDLSRHLHSLSKLDLGPMQRQPVVDRLLALLETAQPSAGDAEAAAAAAVTAAPAPPASLTMPADEVGTAGGSNDAAAGTAIGGLAAAEAPPAAAAAASGAAAAADGAPVGAEAGPGAAVPSPARVGGAALPSLREVSFLLQTLGHCTEPIPSGVVNVAVGAAEGRASEARGSDVANVLWGLARLQMQQPGLDVRLSLIEEYVARAAEIAPEMPHRHLSMVLWAVATLSRGCPDDATLTALADAFIVNIDQAPTQATSNAVWALGKLRWHHAPLLAAATEVAALRASEFGTQGWTGLLWGFHWLGADPTPLADAVVPEVTRAKGLKPDAKLAAAGTWALAAVGNYSHPLVALLRGGLATIQWADAESLKIIGQAHALAVAEGAATWKEVPSRYRNTVQAGWLDRPGSTAAEAARDAMLEEIVVGALRAGLTCPGQKRPVQKFRVLGGALHVDVAMDVNAKVGLLLAGPGELVRNTGRPVGRLAFRLKLLQLVGWRVGVVSMPEWQSWDTRVQEVCLARIVESLSAAPHPEPAPGIGALEKGAANRTAAVAGGRGGGKTAAAARGPSADAHKAAQQQQQPQPSQWQQQAQTPAAAAAAAATAEAADPGAAADAATAWPAAGGDVPEVSDAAMSEDAATSGNSDSPPEALQQPCAAAADEQQLHGSALAEAQVPPSAPALAPAAANTGSGGTAESEANGLAAATAAPPAGAAGQQLGPPAAMALPFVTGGGGSSIGRRGLLGGRRVSGQVPAAAALAGGSPHRGRRALVALGSCSALSRSRRGGIAAAASGGAIADDSDNGGHRSVGPPTQPEPAQPSDVQLGAAAGSSGDIAGAAAGGGSSKGGGPDKAVANDSKDGGHRSVGPTTQPEPAQPSDGQLDAATGGDNDVAGAAHGSNNASGNGDGGYDAAEESESGGWMDTTCDEEVCSLDFGD